MHKPTAHEASADTVAASPEHASANAGHAPRLPVLSASSKSLEAPQPAKKKEKKQKKRKKKRSLLTASATLHPTPLSYTILFLFLSHFLQTHGSLSARNHLPLVLSPGSGSDSDADTETVTWHMCNTESPERQLFNQESHVKTPSLIMRSWRTARLINTTLLTRY